MIFDGCSHGGYVLRLLRRSAFKSMSRALKAIGGGHDIFKWFVLELSPHTSQPPSPKSKREISLQLHRVLCHAPPFLRSTAAAASPVPFLRRCFLPSKSSCVPGGRDCQPSSARQPRLGLSPTCFNSHAVANSRLTVAISRLSIAPSPRSKWTSLRQMAAPAKATSPSSPRSPPPPSPPAIGLSFSKITTNVGPAFALLPLEAVADFMQCSSAPATSPRSREDARH
jgi:hypothetical protein